jgi:hypothetical protein
MTGDGRVNADQDPRSILADLVMMSAYSVQVANGPGDDEIVIRWDGEHGDAYELRAAATVLYHTSRPIPLDRGPARLPRKEFR